MSGGHHPRAITPAGHVEPCPRRIRAEVAGATVLDTTRALYLWEWPYYPQYLIPRADLTAGAEGLGVDHAGPPDHVRLPWEAADAWFEEEEEVFVHPRSPYVRVDALRSRRRVRVSLDGVTLAESDAPVAVFETGLPTRWYLDRSGVDFAHLRPSDTVTRCPYKGTTSHTWSVQVGDALHPDLAWSYDFPTRQLEPVAGLVAFYDESVDVELDGVAQPRPDTHFSR